MDILRETIEVECLVVTGMWPITVGNVYKVYAQDELCYFILDDNKREDWYNKDWFKVVSWN